MLLGYNQSPCVCCLEHDEQRQLQLHPERADEYAKLIEKRQQKRRGRKRIKLSVQE